MGVLPLSSFPVGIFGGHFLNWRAHAGKSALPRPVGLGCVGLMVS